MKYIGIDPSSKTGIVVLDEKGNVVSAQELEIKRTNKDPERMYLLIDWIFNEAIKHNWKTKDADEPIQIAIEGFSYNSKGSAADFQYGLGWGVRLQFYKYNVKYIDIAPSVVKKFATGKGNTKKDLLGIEIYKRWGFEHTSDNVRDAYVLAQILRYKHQNLDMTTFQKDALKKVSI